MARSAAARVVPACTAQSDTPAPRRAALPVPRSGAFRPLPRLSPVNADSLHEQQALWCLAAQRGDEAAAAALVGSLRGFVLKFCHYWLRRTKAIGMQAHDLEDMESFVNIVLLRRCIPRFDPTRGFRVITYAKAWIEFACRRWVADYARAIRVPVHLIDTRNKLGAVRRRLAVELGRPPRRDDLAAEAGITLDKMARLEEAFRNPLPLDAPLEGGPDDRAGSTLLDLLASDHQSAEERVIDDSQARMIESLLGELGTRARQVMRWRYVDGLTLQEIGERMDLSRERIRQIEEAAMKHLKTAARRRGLER